MSQPSRLQGERADFAWLPRPVQGINLSGMNPVAEPMLEVHRAEIAELCRRHRVARLEIFGSGADGRFDSATSDLDFLVAFESKESAGASDRYFGLLWGLEAMFRRPIDLLEAASVQNPYLQRGIDRARELLYAA